MRPHGFLACCFLTALCIMPAFGQHQVVMKNGNQVVGDIQLPALKLKTGVGVMDVPINEIKAIQGNNITLGDGTTITGAIVDRTFGVQTRYGLVTIQTQDIKGIVSMAPPGAPGSASRAARTALSERDVGAQRKQGTFMSPTTVTSRIGPTVEEAQAEDATGPKKRVAIRRFDNKTAIASQGQHNIGTGMMDMLTTAMVNTGRFIVLEREQMNDVMTEQNFGASGRVRGNTAARIGDVEGAELLIYGAVTDYMADQRGVQAGAGQQSGAQIGSLFGPMGMVFGAIAGGLAASASAQQAHVAIDLRLVDANTGRVVAATTVQGRPKSFGAEIQLGIFGGSGFSKTPIGLAIRDCIQNAVNWMLITSFPDEKEKFLAAAAAAEEAAKPNQAQKLGANAEASNAESKPSEGVGGFFSRLFSNDKKPVPERSTAATARSNVAVSPAVTKKVEGNSAIDDVAAVPGLNDSGREGYRRWLQAKLPRAFVIDSNGAWNSATGTNPENPEDPEDPSQRAMENCEKRGTGECKLYAVDNEIVWNQ